jgi:outer membrane protein, multidrug efflux system
MPRNIATLSLICLLFLGGCSLKPELQIPSLELPQSQQEALHVNASWWEKFGDAKLNALIEEAINNNDEIKLSALRILKAKQAYGLSDASLYPTLSATAGSSRQKTSYETYQHNRNEYTDNTMALNLGYEIDFWGKLSNQAQSNWELYLASNAAAQTVKNTLIHEITLAYFNLASLHERLNIIDETIQTYKAVYDFRSKQLKLGSINELLVSQAQAQYLNAINLKSSLVESKKLQENALLILLGKSPKVLFEANGMSTHTLPKPIEIAQGIPSSILENRPDIQEALSNLKSKNALIGVEKAAYFPSISLTGSFGQQSESLDNILKSSANRWSFGPSLSVPIFDFERIKTRVALSQTELQSSLIAYEQTVKKAYKEVSDALLRNAILKEKVLTQEEETAAYSKALSLSTKRFNAGAITYLEVLDAQKGFLNAQLNGVSTKQSYLVSQAELFKAMGSGWNEKDLLGEKQ